MQKKCSKCKETKLSNKFSKDSRSKSGFQSYCRDCRKKYYKKNTEKAITLAKKYYKANPEKCKVLNKRWRETNQVRNKINDSKYNCKRKNRIWNLTNEEAEKMMRDYCHYCGRRWEDKIIGIDRIDSLKGYTTENTVACCWQCNHSKRDHPTKSFIKMCTRVHMKHIEKINMDLFEDSDWEDYYSDDPDWV